MSREATEGPTWRLDQIWNLTLSNTKCPRQRSILHLNKGLFALVDYNREELFLSWQGIEQIKSKEKSINHYSFNLLCLKSTPPPPVPNPRPHFEKESLSPILFHNHYLLMLLFIYLFIYTTTSYVRLQCYIQFEIKFIEPWYMSVTSW